MNINIKKYIVLLILISCSNNSEDSFDYSWESNIESHSYLLKEDNTYNTNRVLVTKNFHVYSNGANDRELINYAKNAEQAYSNLLSFFLLESLKFPTRQEKFEIIYDIGKINVSHAFRYGFIIYKNEFGVNLEVIQHELFHNFQFILTNNKFDRHRWLYEGVAHIGANYSKDNITKLSELNERKHFFENVLKTNIMDMDLNDLLDSFKEYDNVVYHYYSLAHLLAKYIFDPKGFGLNRNDIKKMYELMAQGHDHITAINTLSGKNVLVIKDSLFETLEKYLKMTGTK